MNHLNEIYFKAGQDWYSDRYESVKIQANRWFMGFIASTFVSVLLVILLTILLPLKTLVPLVIHQNTTTGEVWVERPKKDYVPANDAQVQSDIVRYLTLHESYTAADINQRFKSVTLLSNNAIAKQYADEQSNANKQSPVNLLGHEGTRTVRIEDIVYIDSKNAIEMREFKEPAHNLAKVDFITTTRQRGGQEKVQSWVATIGWTYKGLPNNQQEAWENWNGFTVTTLRIDPKNIGQ